MHKLSDIQFLPFALFDAKESFLVVYEAAKTVPFIINRIFMIKSIANTHRGCHAHKECAQLLIVLSGECTVTCDDSTMRETFVLNKASEGLLIPPTIWAAQAYQPNTILMVLADKPYDANDYIRNYDDFVEFRKQA